MARGEVGQINYDRRMMGLVRHYKGLRLSYGWWKPLRVLSRGVPPSDLRLGSSLWQLQTVDWGLEK